MPRLTGDTLGALQADGLMAALSAAGLRVGVAEILRVRQVFGHEPLVNGPTHLASLLRAALARDDEQRAIVDRVTEAWLASAGQVLAAAEPQVAGSDRIEAPPPAARRERGARPSSSGRSGSARQSRHATPFSWRLSDRLRGFVPGQWLRWIFIVAVGLVFLGAALDVLPVLITTWAATRNTWLGAVAAVVALVIAVLIRVRRSLPAPGSLAVGAEAPREFLPPIESKGLQLLGPRDQEALVWGIEHFVSEEPTPHLDLPGTVRETARAGGVPQARFRLARHAREVWLWVDDSSSDSAPARLASEIEASLRTNGLPVERASFWGVPHVLYPVAGLPFGPQEAGERRDAALVAILTDGRLLGIQHSVDTRRVALAALLRDLSRWPRLTFVDFSADAELRRTLAAHGVEAVAPHQLAAYLGASEAARLVRRPDARERSGLREREAENWAAACSLSPAGSADEGTALALGSALGVSPWSLPALLALAPGPPGRVAWSPRDSARWLGAFAHTEVHPTIGVAPSSRLDLALRFWETRYDRELARRTAEVPASVTSGMAALGETPRARLRLEREVLRLWREPAAAARALHALFGGALVGPIREHLGRLTAADIERAGLVRLPWRYAALGDAERAMLQEMGFAGGSVKARLRAAGRLWLALGIVSALALTLTGTVAWSAPVAVGWLLGAALVRRLRARVDAGVVASPSPLPTGESDDSVSDAAPDQPGKVPAVPLPAGIKVLETTTFPSITVDERGHETERREVTASFFAEDLGGGAQIAMTFIPGGRFLMGSPDSEADRARDEGPQHEVSLGAFYLGRHPVTQQQWRAVARLPKQERDLQQDPSRFKGDDNPVEQVSWHDAVEFCRRLSRHTGRDYRLPSEAEWEYACRAGTTTAYHFGPTITPDLVNYNGEHPYGAAPRGLYRQATTPVGERGAANAFGLFDMHGNVREWCQDGWHGDYNGAPTDGSAWEADGGSRVVRGGSWVAYATRCRSAFRALNHTALRGNYVGFRVLCSVARTR